MKRSGQRTALIKCTGFFLIALLIFSILGVASAASWPERFKEANLLYRNGKYAQAAAAYEDAVKLKPVAEAYYNLGNAYFKDKKLGLAILNYERARNLAPRDRDTRANLAYANHLIEYKIEDKRNWYFRKTAQLLSYVTFSECWVLALGAYLIFIAGFLISFLRRKPFAFGTSGVLAVVFVLFCSFPLILKYGESGAVRHGVVTDAQAEVRYGPTNSDRIAFRLVEGLEISINDQKQDWYRIQLNDGRSGWVPASQVTPI